MPLRSRVGRHAVTGAQCQNRVEDQFQVIMSLNFIPTVDAGAQAGLSTDPVISGIASDALCKAILRFQKQHFPTQQSGFVDPGGVVLAKMEMLASQPVETPNTAGVATPDTAGQWGEFQSGSVPRALRAALMDNHF